MNSFIHSIQKIIERDLTVLEKEINLYTTQESIWVVNKEIKNSAGNLCLHLCGNLQQYIGKVLGGSAYIRDRENEFSATGISKEILLSEVSQTKNAVMIALSKLDADELQKQYPEEVFKTPMTTEYFLIHLTAHLGYHLGQINYHRRLL
jgi:uncharacterized damage-inducible protein DinB